MGFKKDLEAGQSGEAAVCAALLSANIKSQPNADKNKRKDYDLECETEDGRKFTIEVKLDLYAAKSGNIAIEFFNPKTGQPSGLSATKADLWAHITTEPFTVWMTSVTKLKKFVEVTKPKRTISSGGDSNASLYLYDKDLILPAVFDTITDVEPLRLQKLIGDLLTDADSHIPDAVQDQL